MALMEREFIKIVENGKKRETEISAELDAECKKIDASANLEYEKTMAENKIVTAKILAEGNAEALKIKSENKRDMDIMIA
jgi:hypothetical protein